MYEIFERLLKEKGVSVADVSRATGIRHSTFSNWKKRGGSLTANYAKMVAAYFGISVDELYGNTSKSFSYNYKAKELFESQLRLDGWTIEHINPAEGKPCNTCPKTQEDPWWTDPDGKAPELPCETCLLGDAKCIISKGDYSLTLSEDDFEKMVSQNQADAISAVLNSEMDKANAQSKIPIVRRVAAGLPLDSIEELIGWEEPSPGAQCHGTYFGLLIQGNSMEPTIMDGDTIIVRQQPTAENGEIVVALVNGNDGVCKRFKRYPDGTIALISDNPEYKPMYFSGSEIDGLPVRIAGVVKELRRKF